jgi:EAL domain-containing protein (putative c-di-GMP-specific phosphodiesterase class I)
MQTKAWHDEGFFPLSIAVNLSGRQFQHHYLPDTVAAVLEATGLAPEFLELEITESVAMRNVEISTSMMRTLRGQGVKLALDDFGVGYSSLISLKQFPISTLKIDRHFVRGIAEDPVDAAIVEAVVSMGRSLRLHVVAEGVETEGQLAVLRTCRCDGMQGFLFCRPVTADAVRPLLPRMVSGDVGSSPA